MGDPVLVDLGASWNGLFWKGFKHVCRIICFFMYNACLLLGCKPGAVNPRAEMERFSVLIPSLEF